MLHRTIWVIGILAVTYGAAGCSKSEPTGQPNAVGASGHANDGAHSHDGWWCNEHGVPEEVCAQCNVKLAANFRAKGDWCKEHDRPDSQCFVCHPEKEAEFAAQYEAKYGTKPPKPSAEEHADSDRHDAKS